MTLFEWKGSDDRARGGVGQTHHIAFRTPHEESQAAARERLLELGIEVTEVRDRLYFKSIYFRSPDGRLCEIATDGPGFAVDEDPATLGERIALPPFLEDRREEIVAGLRPIE